MKHLLSSSAYLVVNKNLCKVLGIKATILLADLISKEEYFRANHLLKDGWFFNTESNIEEDTTLTPYQQRKALKILKDKGIVDTKRVGVPAKINYQVNEQLVVKFLNNLSLSKCITINKNKVIRINNKTFIKPTVEDVKNYCLERKNNINAETFIDFYESKGWKIGKNKMKDWKAAIRTWEKRQKPTMSKIDIQLNEYEKGKKLL
tara:strand:- start:891 stop:1505 length:615 start_codon:yes stop_codon:yes gene_type:complete